MKVAVDQRKSLYYFSNELVFSALGRTPINLKVKAGSRKNYSYRGSIAITPQKSGLRGINIVDIEDYLKSVVPCEIFNRAPDAAQQAQAIAARTYAVRNLHRHSNSDNFQLCDTVHCQAYTGIAREIKFATKAVKDTYGKILTFGKEPANTVYHSNCGGYLIDSRAAWNGSEVPYLIGHFDGIAVEKPFCFYGSQIKKNKLTCSLPKTRPSISIKRMPAKSKKACYKNFGHRVGMCQDGAIGMAAIGYNSRQILDFYYPGTRLATMRYADPSTAPVETQKPIVVASLPMPNPEQIELITPPNPTQLNALRHSNKTRQNSRSIRETLKQISTGKNGSKAHELRKIFWTPGQPEISRSIY